MDPDPNTLNRVLTAKGYAVKKSSLTTQEQQVLRQTLTVSPALKSRVQTASQPFAVYYESPQRFYLPRSWAKEFYGPPELDLVPEGESLPESVVFKGKPFDYQENIVNTFLTSGANGLICVPCGKGKTFMALCIASRIKRRFLVIVDKEFLLNQWKGEIEAFFPGLRIGIVQGQRCEVDPAKYDVTLCMLQTLCQKEFPQSTFKTYGFAIFDECHHLGAAHFSRALLKIQTKYMLGLSATPIRDDGLTKVFEWYLGKPVYWEKRREADPTVVVKTIQFKADDGAYMNEPVDYKGEVVMARLLTQIVDFEPRTRAVVKLCIDLFEESGRRVLILSERKSHLQRMEELLGAERPDLTIGYYIGGMKEEVREKGGRDANILLATYAMASEAMNIKSLNSVILASPRKKVEQSVGRILRQRPEERVCQPIILDILDAHGIYQGQYRKRRAFYKACGYKIETQIWKDGDVSEESEEEGESGSSDESESEEITKAIGKCGFVDD